MYMYIYIYMYLYICICISICIPPSCFIVDHIIIQLFSALHQVSSAQIGFSRVMSWPKDWLLKRLLVQCLRSEKLEKKQG